MTLCAILEGTIYTCTCIDNQRYAVVWRYIVGLYGVDNNITSPRPFQKEGMPK